MGSELSKSDDPLSSPGPGPGMSGSSNQEYNESNQVYENPALQDTSKPDGAQDTHGSEFMLSRSNPQHTNTSSIINNSHSDGAGNSSSDHDGDSNMKFLLGNLENLPASARKLYSMGKLYLNKHKEREEGYAALFKTLPSQGEDAHSAGENTMEDEHSIQNTLVRNIRKASNLFVPMPNSSPLHCAQTYVQWRAAHDLLSMYSFCLPIKNAIYLQPIDAFPPFVNSFFFHTNHMNLNFFEMLQGFTQIFFSGMEVVIQPPVFVNELDWNVRSRLHETTNQMQYCVTDLHSSLQKIAPKDARCIVGISWTDLYPEGFNFVLGEASDVHRAAVISFGRFETTDFNAETHCDISKMDAGLVWKLLKTISHEVCHVFGFSHCSFFLCAMNESSSVSHAMSQPLFLCPVCLRKLQKVCGFDIIDRYRLLHKFFFNLEQQMGDCPCVNDAVAWLETCLAYLTSTTD